MELCWRDDSDLCDVRSDASLLRMIDQIDSFLRPVDMLEPGSLPLWVHWFLGVLISVTGRL